MIRSEQSRSEKRNSLGFLCLCLLGKNLVGDLPTTSPRERLRQSEAVSQTDMNHTFLHQYSLASNQQQKNCKPLSHYSLALIQPDTNYTRRKPYSELAQEGETELAEERRTSPTPLMHTSPTRSSLAEMKAEMKMNHTPLKPQLAFFHWELSLPANL